MKTKTIIAAFFTIFLISACAPATPAVPTPDVNVARTSAAYTVVAEFTLTAAAFTPTSAPPTETPIPEEPSATPTVFVVVTNPQGTELSICDKYQWGADVDVNIPDDTQMTPGQAFTKTWRIKNIGSCTWGSGYKLVYAGYTVNLNGKGDAIPAPIQPGQTVDVTVQFTAPNEKGEFVSAWTLQNDKGYTFFGNENKPLYVKILVK